jgi:hypothetical protein
MAKSNSNPASTSDGLDKFLATYGNVSSEDLLRGSTDEEIWAIGAGTWQSPAQSNS